MMLALGFCLASTRLAAQEDGVSFRMGLGYGSMRFSCDTCDLRRATGGSRWQLGGWGFSGAVGWRENAHLGVRGRVPCLA
jgi:hypothetical protein